MNPEQREIAKISFSRIIILVIALVVIGLVFSFMKNDIPKEPSDTPASTEKSLLSEKETLEIAQNFVIEEGLKEVEDVGCLDFDGIRNKGTVTYAVTDIPKEGCTNLPHAGNYQDLFVQVDLTTGETLVVDSFPKEGPEVIISSIIPASAKIGQTVEIHGTNFSGFEGDKNVWIENTDGKKGIIYGMVPQSTDSLIRFTLENKYCTKDNSYSGEDCMDYLVIIPGKYTIYTYPWGNMSNKVEFIVSE